MFDFFFSPSGCVGRGAWWVTQVVVDLLLFGMAFQVLASMPESVRHSPHLLAAQFAYLQQQSVSEPGISLALLASLAAVLWWSFVIEIKRWHDRGMSGFWVLLRSAGLLVPRVGMAPVFIFALLTAIVIFRLVNLGFMGPPVVPLRKARDRNVPLVIAAGVLLIVVALLLFFRNSSTHRTESAPVASTQPPQNFAPAPAPPSRTLDESAFHGTSAMNYGRDWVVLSNGTRYDRITAVTAAPGAQVAILNPDGGMDVPAAALPQGFLDEWNMTPQALKSANQP